MSFAAYDRNASDSNYFVTRELPSDYKKSYDPKVRILVTDNTVAVPPVDIAYSEWMTKHRPPGMPIKRITASQFIPLSPRTHEPEVSSPAVMDTTEDEG